MRWYAMAAVMSALIVGTAVVSAQEPMITDGRVNGWDLAAPVAVYCEFDNPDADDPDYSELESIELWGIDDEGEGFFALSANAETIRDIGYSTDEDRVIASEGGYTLARATDGSVYVTAPAHADGQTYWFNWEFGDQNC